ncbi:hypothetical protein [Haloferula sargassicola]|uniref:Uncharacterized protein n=1 Tax=Haloferula sargassicola TaxID=490096 RepID=A0ABP9UVC1_9BACT
MSPVLLSSLAPFLTSAVTVVCGVIVFVTGQILLKRWIEPVVELKRSLGFVSSVFLRHQAKITNGRCNDEIQDDLHQAASQLLVHAQAIPAYNISRKVFGLPTGEELVRAAQAMNLIASRARGEETQGSVEDFNRSLREVGEALGIRVDYRG